jgi:serine/threonine-protein kinase SRPK3
MESASRSCSSSSSYSSDVEDAQDYRKGGYHPAKIGDVFHQGRYQIVKKLGWGHFSTVWLVKDLKGSKDKPAYGAMKIQKSATHYTEAAMDEVKILKQIKAQDPEGKEPVLHLLDWFEHHGPNGKHVCMVLGSLGDNLLTLVKLYDYRGIPLEVAKMVARCSLKALDFLHSKLQIIHTDLKLENILLMGKIPRTWKKKKKKPKEKSQKSSNSSKKKEETNATEIKKRDEHKHQGNGHSSSQPEGKIAQAIASGVPLTKNQKKKLKKKQKKLEALKMESLSMDASPAEMEMDGVEPTKPPLGEKPEEQPSKSRKPKSEKSKKEEEAVLSYKELLESIPKECKVIDLGNACWTYKKFTSDIQTRQYRCPEVILGASYSTPADIWSLACIIFELVTGDYLFEPKSSKNYSRDEDHLALFQEALGKIPKRVSLKGKYARDFFNRNGELRHIKKLQHWPLLDVLIEKYDLDPKEAESLASFLLQGLEYESEKRATAREMLKHPWLAE